MYVIDLETNRLHRPDHIWVLVAIDTETGEMYTFTEDKMDQAIELLNGEIIIGHNAAKFDYPVLKQHYPDFQPKKVYDTMILAPLIWNDMKALDMQLIAKGIHIPTKFRGRLSLEAFGYRTGILKGQYGKKENAWDALTDEMIEYCQQDVRITFELWKRIMNYKDYLARIKHVVDMEHQVADIIGKQEDHGFLFDHARALEYVEEIESELRKLWAQIQAEFPPQRSGKKMVPFNPNSHMHIKHYLLSKGWKPTQFTETGEPVVSWDVLEELVPKYPEIELVAKYLYLKKVLGFLKGTKNAWLNYIESDGRIRGGVLTLGTVSHRMAHFAPNLAQVPARGEWGEKLRSLFIAPEGKVLVGIDAGSLELRILAHYLARWDRGAYAKKVVSIDMHQYHADILGITRQQAKRFIYAWMYGGGEKLLGSIVGGGVKEGKALKEQFMENIAGFKELSRTVYKIAQSGYVTALDGRKLRVRKPHAALNLLIQSAGAIIMKRALVIFYDRLLERGYEWGKDFAFVNNVHDEWQLEVRPEIAEEVAQLGVQSIRDVADYYKMSVELDGEYKIGSNWSETH